MKNLARNIFSKWAVLLVLTLAVGARGEQQSSVSVTEPQLFSGRSGTFTVSNITGAVAVGAGTATYTYSGVYRYLLNSASGRYSGLAGTNIYGVSVGPFQVLQSFLDLKFFTVVSSATLCPSYYQSNYLNIRVRTPDASRGAMNALATSYIAGGTQTYDPTAAHLITGNTTFDLEGPAVNSTPGYTYDPVSAECASGSVKVSATGANQPLDQYGTYFFADNSYLGVSYSGNPIVTLGVAQQTLTSGAMSALSTSVFSGLYTNFTSSAAQIQNNVYLFPDSNGTTYTIYTANDVNNPSLKTQFGTLACTSLNSPSNGFCSGTLSLVGVSGSANAVCMFSTLTPEMTVACEAETPGNTTLPITIVGKVPAKAVLAVSVPSTAASVAPNGSTTITATLQNMTGTPITSLANPTASGLPLAAPFSDAGAYAGTGGTCGSTLAGFASCTVTITFSPTAVGTYLQIFRVAYKDGFFGTVNATTPILGTSGLSSLAITPSTTTFPDGSSVQYTVTATYSDSSTQNVTSSATWSTSNSNATTNSTGDVTFVNSGSVTVSASLGGISASQSVTSTGSSVQELGQTSTTGFDGATAGLNSPGVGLLAGGRLFLSDANNNRILIYNSVPSANNSTPDLVLGQPYINSNSANYGGISAKTLSNPTGLATDGTHLAVADTNNNRVLFWNTIPLSLQQPADLVLGQTSFTGSTANSGGISGSTLNSPSGVAINNGVLLIADSANNRVLIWTTLPTSNGQVANLVLGQSSMSGSTANSGGVSLSSLNNPIGTSYDGTHLVVADTYNSRVLIWNALPTTNNQASSFELGQPSASSNTADNGGISTSTLAYPTYPTSDGTHLAVADYLNNRVLIWNTFPAANQTAASIVLGQPSTTSNTANNGGVTAKSMSSASGVWTNGSVLYVADYGNNRLLTWTTFPTTNDQAANLVQGQPSFTANLANNPGAPTSTSINVAQGVHGDGTHLFVADTGNNRVLIWSTVPSANDQAASIVLGQALFTTSTANSGGISASSLSGPTAVFSDGTKLYVADTNNNRVLIWNSIPTSNNQAANVVLGQSSFTGATANSGGVAATTLSGPTGVYVSGTKLFVADSSNNRVLVWTTIPTVNQTAASFVLGQTSFTGISVNAGGSASGQTMSAPRNVHGDSSHLFVADSGNNRVLEWTSIPTATNQAANFAIGQTSLTATAAGVTSATLNRPGGVFDDGTHLLVSDYNNNRVLIYASIPSANGTAASTVLGQVSFTANVANGAGESALTMSGPIGIYSDGYKAWVTDQENSRVLVSSINALLSFSVASYDYGVVGLTVSNDAIFTVANSGAGTASSMAAGTPALAAPFSYKGGSYPGTGGTCGTTLAGQKTCTVVATFAPTTDASAVNDTLRLSYNDGATTKVAYVAVSGTGTNRAALTFSDGSSYAYGAVTANTTASHTFTVSNSSGVTATLMRQGSTALSSTFAFPDGNYPGLNGTCGTVLATGSTCTILVTFTPTNTSSSSGTLQLQYSDGTSTQNVSIALSGSGK